MNDKIRGLIDEHVPQVGLGLQSNCLVTYDYLINLVKAVAYDCETTCLQMGTAVAGCDGNVPTKIADDCADWIKRDYDL